ncbi:MAG: DUF3467 domain-containing protein [Chloroflexota bacterium]
MAETGKQPQRPANQKRVKINIPKDLEAVYANVAILSNTAAEIILDFGQILPHMPTAPVKARIIMSPIHAKMLHARLGQQIASYEQQNGEIKLPQSLDLASQFFKIDPPGSDKKDGPDENA